MHTRNYVCCVFIFIAAFGLQKYQMSRPQNSYFDNVTVHEDKTAL